MMKHEVIFQKLVMSVLVIVGIPVLFSTPARGELCASTFHISPLPPEVIWRKDTTHVLPNGEIVPSSGNREKNMQTVSLQMEDFILNFKGEYGTGDIPPMRFFPVEGANIHATAVANGLNGIITQYSVSGVGAKAAIEGTLLLPVSGHSGNSNARTWALTDTYDVRLDSNPTLEPATHYSYGHTRKEKILVKDTKSLGLVTKQEVSIPLIAHVPVVVLYYRRGSAGPSGYIEGRVMEFLWNGT
jgi:hypothetical protein